MTEAQDPVATFSILGFDPATGEIGGAVQSRVFSVGNGVLWAEAGVGAAGVASADVIRQIYEADTDPGLRGRAWPKAGRQFAVMSAKGEHAAFTGPKASSWAGHKAGT